MEIIKKNLVVIVIVLILLVLILFRSIGLNHFKTDAKSYAEASLLQSNILTPEKLKSLQGDKLLINLDIDSPNELTNEAIRVSPDSILVKSHINTIMKHDGPVVVWSSEPALSARIWMLLSQLGRKDIFILSNSDNETLNYKFQRDSLSQGVINK
jgi:hypothetical protein